MKLAHLRLVTKPFYVSTTFNKNLNQKKKLTKNIKSFTSLLASIGAKIIVERHTQSYRTEQYKNDKSNEFCGGKWHFNWYSFCQLLLYSLFKIRWDGWRVRRVVVVIVHFKLFIRANCVCSIHSISFMACLKSDHKRESIIWLYN